MAEFRFRRSFISHVRWSFMSHVRRSLMFGEFRLYWSFIYGEVSSPAEFHTHLRGVSYLMSCGV